MSPDDIEKILRSIGKTRILKISGSPEIHRIELLDPGEPAFDPNALYFCTDAEWNRCRVRPACCVLAAETPPNHFSSYAAGTNPDPRTNPAQTAALRILIAPDMFSAAFNAVRAALETDACPDFYCELKKVLEHTRSLNQMIEAAALRLGNCLILCDTEYRILSYSRAVMTSDPFWTKNIAQGFCSYDFIRETNKIDAVRKGRRQREAFEVICPMSPNRKLVCEVFRGGRSIAYLLLIDDHTPLTDTHYTMLRQAADVISECSAQYLPEILSEPDAVQRLLYELLIGGTTQEFSEELQSAALPERMYTACFRRINDADQRTYVHRFVTKLRKLFPGSEAVDYRGELTAMIPCTGPDIPEKDVQTFEQLGREEHRRIGLSSVYSSMEDFLTSHREASDAVRLGPQAARDRFAFRYSDYAVYALLDRETSAANLRAYTHPALSILRAYDETNGTQLLETLRCYVRNDGKSAAAAQELYIHRNTLTYRLDRIRDLTGINDQDAKTRFALQLSFAIDRYLTQK